MVTPIVKAIAERCVDLVVVLQCATLESKATLKEVARSNICIDEEVDKSRPVVSGERRGVGLLPSLEIKPKTVMKIARQQDRSIRSQSKSAVELSVMEIRVDTGLPDLA